MKMRFIILFFLPFTALAQSLQEGQNELYNERYNKAKSVLEALIAKEPTNAEAFFYAGRAYKALGDNAKAKELFNKGIAANPKSGLNFVGLGSVLLSEKDSVQAKANFDKALAAGAKDAKTLMYLAEAWISSEKKSIGRAIDFANKSIAIDKKNPEAHIILGDAFALDPDKGGPAMTSYEHAVETDPKYARGYMKMALLYMRSRNTEEPLKNFDLGINADGVYTPNYREYAEFMAQAKKYEKAAEFYKKYLELTENPDDKLVRYAQLQFLSKDYKGTIETSNKVLAKDPSNVILKRLIGYSYYEEGKFPEGLSYMEKFFQEMDTTKIIPSDYEYQGKLLVKTGNDSLAIEYLTKALKLDSTEVELWGELAQALYKKKRYLEAADAFTKKLAKGKQLSADFFMLGKSYYYGGNYSKADTAFIKVTELSPNSHIGFMWRGRSNNNLDSLSTARDLAKPYYEKTIELATDTVKYKKDIIEALEFLGFNAIQHDDEKTAKMYYEKALAYDPENKNALSVLEQLKKKGKP